MRSTQKLDRLKRVLFCPKEKKKNKSFVKLHNGERDAIFFFTKTYSKFLETNYLVKIFYDCSVLFICSIVHHIQLLIFSKTFVGL